MNARTTYDDPEVSPVIRQVSLLMVPLLSRADLDFVEQTLQHWGYLLTEDDFNRCVLLKGEAASSLNTYVHSYCKLKNLK